MGLQTPNRSTPYGSVPRILGSLVVDATTRQAPMHRPANNDVEMWFLHAVCDVVSQAKMLLLLLLSPEAKLLQLLL